MRTSNLRRPLAGVPVAAVAVALGLAAASPAQAQEDDTSQVSVVHGIPDQNVDVYVDGDPLLEDFPPGEVTEPLELPAGTYEVVLTEPGGDPDSDPIVSDDAVEVTGGENLSLVAHLDEGGEPTLTPFTNDVDSLSDDGSRLTVRHTAAAPAVDVEVDGEVVISGLSNPNEETLDQSAGSYSVEVLEAGTDTAVLGPADVELTDGVLTVAYAIGSADEDTLELLIQTVEPSEAATPVPGTPTPESPTPGTPTPGTPTPESPTPGGDTPTPEGPTPAPDQDTPGPGEDTPGGGGGMGEIGAVAR